MTKEELAKKKGIKLEQSTQTAAEALITTKTETKAEVKPAPKKTPKKAKIEASAKAQAESIEPKKKVGRPKGEPTTKFNLLIPDVLMPSIKTAASLRNGGNVTAYIVSLINEDMKANASTYDQVKKLTLK